MDLLKRLLVMVVVCILFLPTGREGLRATPIEGRQSVSAAQGSSYPASSSTSSSGYFSTITSATFLATKATSRAMSTSGSTPGGIYYVPGWNCAGWYDSLEAAEATCSAGASAWAGHPGWTLVWQATGPAPPNPYGAAYGIQCVSNASCIWHGGAFTAPDGSNYLNGTSHGGEDIFEQDCNLHYYWDGDTHTCISPSNNPGKNLGNGAGCDGGNGSPNGDSSAGGSAENGGPSPCKAGRPTAGDPINTATGNSYQQTTDIHINRWLTFRRFYNSSPMVAPSTLGEHWRNSFDRSLQLVGSPIASIVLMRPDGKRESFFRANGVWVTDADNPDTLEEQDDANGNPIDYVALVAGPRQFEHYSATGALLSIEDESGFSETFTYSTSSTPASIAPIAGLILTAKDPYGHALSFTYDTSARIHQVMLPDGGAITYAYDANNNLSQVTYPDAKTRQYTYNEQSLTSNTNLAHALTGVIDETGTRYEETGYDSSGRAILSGFAVSIDTTGITYNSDGSATVQYPLGVSSVLGFNVSQGTIKVESVSQSCGVACNQPWKTRIYDTNGYPVSYTDFNGTVTMTTYDANGLLDQQIAASGTASQRTTNFIWNMTLRVPLTRTVLDANGKTVSSTQWIYNAAGQTLVRCDIDSTNSAASGYACSNSGSVPAGVRRWTYIYCTVVDGTQCPIVGLLLSSTGPRTDLTQTSTYSYYLDSATSGCPTPGGACHQPGDLHTITDPLGHVTTVASYDADGRPTRITDANGINTDLTYTPRGWLASRTVGGATTTFGYTPYGTVSSVTDPDGVTTTYGYDAAHRLVKVTDAQGNAIEYTLDAAGNKTAEQVVDANGTVHRSLNRTFNALGQLTTVVDGLNHTVFNASDAGSYDADGNLVQSSDGLGIQRQQSYDALNRLVQTIDNYNGTH